MWDKGYFANSDFDAKKEAIMFAPSLPIEFPKTKEEKIKFWDKARERDSYIASKSWEKGIETIFILECIGLLIATKSLSLVIQIHIFIIGLWILKKIWLKLLKK